MTSGVDQRAQHVIMHFTRKGRTPAGIAAATGELDTLDDLITEEATAAEARDVHMETPLHLAATYGRFEIVKFLIRDYGVAVDPANWEGWTPFLCAISRGHVEIADFLLRNGADLAHAAPTGMTAMHIASWFNQSDSIEYLLAKGAPLAKENVFGCTPITMCRPGPIKRLMFNAQEEAD